MVVRAKEDVGSIEEEILYEGNSRCIISRLSEDGNRYD